MSFDNYPHGLCHSPLPLYIDSVAAMYPTACTAENNQTSKELCRSEAPTVGGIKLSMPTAAYSVGYKSSKNIMQEGGTSFLFKFFCMGFLVSVGRTSVLLIYSQFEIM